MEFYQRNIEEGQTIWDIAVQEYGDVMMAWTILEDNPVALTDLNTDLIPGSWLKIRKEPVEDDKELMNHFRNNQIYVNCKD